jgi:hypothetical protein
MTRIALILPITILGIWITTLSAAPVELGTVEWQRDYEKAAAESKKSGKPVFLLFQEVPG